MRWSRAALAVALGVGIAGTADADLIARDSFIVGTGHYTPGDLTPQDPPVGGFTGAWQDGTSPASNFVVSSAGLDHPVHPGETGGSLSYGPYAGEPQRAYRSLAAYPAPSGSIVYYMSGLLRLDDVIGLTGIALMGFTDSQDLTDAQFFDPTADHGIQGLQWGFLGDGSQIELVLRHRQERTGAIRQYTDTLLANVPAGQTHFVILKLEMDAGAAPNNDRVSVWLNPTTVAGEAVAGTPMVFWDCSLYGDTAIDSLMFAKNSMPNTWSYDEPRFGTTWASVVDIMVVIPEPATLSLLALGGLGLLRRRRRPR